MIQTSIIITNIYIYSDVKGLDKLSILAENTVPTELFIYDLLILGFKWTSMSNTVPETEKVEDKCFCRRHYNPLQNCEVAWKN
jgi:hypothetical protein